MQVGPPPGGPQLVLAHIPVVFFTARGIPGEVDERMDTADGLMAASMRSLRSGSAGGGERTSPLVTCCLHTTLAAGHTPPS